MALVSPDIVPSTAPSAVGRVRALPLTARVGCAAIAGAGVVLRLLIAFRPIDYVDRLFVPDDTYYTLNIARALAHGLGPTADGHHLTNGFQPLLAFLMVPFFWVSRDPDAGLRAVWVLLCVVDGALAFALGELVRRSARRGAELAAVVTTLIWAASPSAIAYCLGGLETSLGLLASVALVLAWSQARETQGYGRFALAGAAAGLALLARVDTVLLVGALGAWELVKGRTRGALVAGAAAVVVVAPWWIYELLRFHSVTPESGPAVHDMIRLFQADDPTMLRGLALVGISLGTVLEAVLGRPYDLRELLLAHGPMSLAIAGVLVLGMAIVAVRAVRPGPSAFPARALVGFGVAIWAFYVLYLPAYHFYPRYISPMHVALAVVLGLVAGRLAVAKVGDRIRWVALAAVITWVALTSVKSATYLTAHPRGSIEGPILGPKGYREPARELVGQVPQGAVIGTLQSGALGYYAGALRPDIQIVNLDGVVDHEAAVAFHLHRFADFGRARGITHLADWPFLIQKFITYSGDPRIAWGSLQQVGTAGLPGGLELHLYQILWPAPLEPGAPLAVAASTDGKATLTFAIDREGALREWVVKDGSWTGPIRIHSTAKLHPSAPLAASGPNPLELLTVDAAGALVALTLDISGGARADPLGPSDEFPPGARVATRAAPGNERVQAFAVDRQGALQGFQRAKGRSWERSGRFEPERGLVPGAGVGLTVPLGDDADDVGLFAVDQTGTLVAARAVSGGSTLMPCGTAGLYPPGAGVAAVDFGAGAPLEAYVVDTQGNLERTTEGQGSGACNTTIVGAGKPLARGAQLALTPEFGVPGQWDVFGVDAQGRLRVAWNHAEWHGPDPLSPSTMFPGSDLVTVAEAGTTDQTDVINVDKDGNLVVTWVKRGAWRGPGILP